MTLGRTSSGAIKLKTDEAGGGLRAVECGCCAPCPVGGYSPFCPNQYDATQQEYDDWRRGGQLSFNISWTLPDTGSVSASDTIIIPANSCVIAWTNGAIYPDNSLSFFYGFLKKDGGGYIFVYGASAGLDGDLYIQQMFTAFYDFFGGGSCQCGTPYAGPFAPNAFVAGRGFCPAFDTVGAVGGELPIPIVANITFTPNPLP